MKRERARTDMLLALAASFAVHLVVAAWIVSAAADRPEPPASMTDVAAGTSPGASRRAASAEGERGVATPKGASGAAKRSVSFTQVRLLRPWATSADATTTDAATSDATISGFTEPGPTDPGSPTPARRASSDGATSRRVTRERVSSPEAPPRRRSLAAAAGTEPERAWARGPSMGARKAGDERNPGDAGGAATGPLHPVATGTAGEELGRPGAASRELGQLLGQVLGGVLAAEGRRLEEGARHDRQAALLQARLAAAARSCYPREARRYGVEGAADVAFCLTRGRLRAPAELSRSSGEPSLDAAALGCVLKGALPATGVEGCFDLEVRFER